MDANELAARVRAIGQLADVVQAMRTLASARRRQAQERFAGFTRYASATHTVLSEALALLGPGAEPAPEAKTGRRRVVALFSEHGFVGPLNDTLLDVSVALSRAGAAEMVAVGSRGLRLCGERNFVVANGGAMPTTLAAVHGTAERLIDEFFGDVAEGGVGEIHMVFAEHQPPLGWAPRTIRLFPPSVRAAEGSRGRERPLHTLAASTLVIRAVEEYAFAQVSWSVGSAFASEHAARFVAMDAAKRHIEDRLEELRAQERSLRQETITNEIVEIASSAELFRGTP
jgi:F-type H+-transporting ATPase subunit gamma